MNFYNCYEVYSSWYLLQEKRELYKYGSKKKLHNYRYPGMLAKFFGKLENQLLLLLVLSTIIPVSLVGGYAVSSSTKALSNSAVRKLEEEVEKEGANILTFLDGIHEDVSFLSKVPPIQGIIRARVGGGIDKQGNSSYELWVERLNTIFSRMMEAKPYYMQLRYLDENGNEMVRVDSNCSIEALIACGGWDDGNKIKVIPKAQLQNKADSSYFTETMKLPAGSIYVSPVELNRENGAIEKPYKPVIHYAIPIFDSAGKRKGIAIADVFAYQFIKSIEEAKLGKDEEQLLVNQDGYYIFHPNFDKEWGFEFNNNEKLNNDYPVEIAQQILTHKRGVIDQGTDHILSYYKVVTNAKQGSSLVVIHKVSKDVVFASVNSFKIAIGIIILLSLATVLPLAILAILRARQLRNLIARLVNKISSSSQEIFSTLEQQECIASQQAASVNETTVTIDELEATSLQSAEQAEATSTASLRALELAEGGTQAVWETLQGMSVLEEKVGAIASQTMRLSEQTNQIGNISGLVSDLASQTNMLALNATVEAVHAGEHGKGFSVVAAEIRKLADQSKKSAENINALVSEIQNEINLTVMVTDEGTKTVKTGVEIAQKTDLAFAGVADAVNKVVLNNQQISLNLKQQVNGMQQVVEAMNNINHGAKETVIGISQTRVGTEELKQAAVQLQKRI